MNANQDCVVQDCVARIARLKSDVAAGTMCALLGLVILMSSCGARAEDFGKPRLLVAAPAVQGMYRHAAIIVLSAQGHHAGFIVNRASPLTLAQAFPDDPAAAKVAQPIFFGGPYGSQSVYAVVRRDPGDGAKRLFGQVYMTASGAAVDRVIARTPGEARYFAGFVAWAPGKLEKEIEAGDWYVGEPDDAMLFHRDTGALWEDLVARLGPAHSAMK